MSPREFQALEQLMTLVTQMGGQEGKAFSHFADNPGVPAYLASVGEDGSREKEEVLSSLKRERLSPSEFGIPTGWRKVTGLGLGR